MQNEMLDKIGNMIYIEKRINKIIQARYWEWIITWSYIYQKMQALVKRRIYIKCWNMGNFIGEVGYVNVFELHRKLTNIIKYQHLPRKHLNIYSEEEKEYMNSMSR